MELIIKIKFHQGLKRWLSSLECLSVFHRTGVHFLVLHRGLTAGCNSSSVESSALFLTAQVPEVKFIHTQIHTYTRSLKLLK